MITSAIRRLLNKSRNDNVEDKNIQDDLSVGQIPTSESIRQEEGTVPVSDKDVLVKDKKSKEIFPITIGKVSGDDVKDIVNEFLSSGEDIEESTKWVRAQREVAQEEAYLFRAAFQGKKMILPFRDRAFP